jgi:hypothetical protein
VVFAENTQTNPTLATVMFAVNHSVGTTVANGKTKNKLAIIAQRKMGCSHEPTFRRKRIYQYVLGVCLWQLSRGRRSAGYRTDGMLRVP